ncbi:MAG: pyruvate kinase, partial [Stagnimonas sp.]|nr:pyruvate kinase [Stagnimonas sp.]
MSNALVRRTKIVTTLGPATDAPQVLRGLVAAGADVMRINFSHGSAADHERRIERVREAAAGLGRDIGVLADLQGPKIRIESFADGPVTLVEGAPFALDIALGKLAGDVTVVGCAYESLPRDVVPGDTLLLNDGAIAILVEKITGTRIDCVVTQGGVLSNRKGINKLGGGLSAAALTDEDKANIVHAVRWDCDFIAVSFPRNAADMHEARRLVKEAGGTALLVAKIERAEALINLKEIIEASDAVMVARGDLGVEIGDAELPGWQKKIITAGREANKMVITATQMMESMIVNPVPTRAEVSDVANAVLDGTDAVMLSAETAAGKYPLETVVEMANICQEAEKAEYAELSADFKGKTFQRIDQSIAMGALFTAHHLGAKAIVA